MDKEADGYGNLWFALANSKLRITGQTRNFETFRITDRVQKQISPSSSSSSLFSPSKNIE
jgi:hypothetical protein